MRVFQGVEHLPNLKNAVLTIGSFDGVHRGHCQLISRINEIARKSDGESVLLTFEPHPRIVIEGENCNLKLLNTPNEKKQRLEANGLQNLVLIPFTTAFSNQSAQEYIEDFLWKNFQPHSIVVGYDHHFGKGREGNIDVMKEQAKKLGFEVVEISKQEVNDIAISSSEIRRSLSSGRIERANELLGYDYSLIGTVVHGEHVGRTIGFPTANLEIESQYKLIPANGVYAVVVEVEGQIAQGMLNIGFRPTFEGVKQTIEVHLFEFHHEIYGERMRVTLKSFVREERKFGSPEELARQLQSDKAVVQKLLT